MTWQTHRLLEKLGMDPVYVGDGIVCTAQMSSGDRRGIVDGSGSQAVRELPLIFQNDRRLVGLA